MRGSSPRSSTLQGEAGGSGAGDPGGCQLAGSVGCNSNDSSSSLCPGCFQCEPGGAGAPHAEAEHTHTRTRKTGWRGRETERERCGAGLEARSCLSSASKDAAAASSFAIASAFASRAVPSPSLSPTSKPWAGGCLFFWTTGMHGRRSWKGCRGGQQLAAHPKVAALHLPLSSCGFGVPREFLLICPNLNY